MFIISSFYSVNPHDYMIRGAVVEVENSPWRRLLASRHDGSLRLLVSLDFDAFEQLYHIIFSEEDIAYEQTPKVGRRSLLTLKDQACRLITLLGSSLHFICRVV
jgi:hypothetical protein